MVAIKISTNLRVRERKDRLTFPAIWAIPDVDILPATFSFTGEMVTLGPTAIGAMAKCCIDPFVVFYPPGFRIQGVLPESHIDRRLRRLKRSPKLRR